MLGDWDRGEDTEQVLSRGLGAGREARPAGEAGPSFGVGGDELDRVEDRVHRGYAAQVGAAVRAGRRAARGTDVGGATARQGSWSVKSES